MDNSVTYKEKSIQHTYGTTYITPNQDGICCRYCIHSEICKYKDDFYNFIDNVKKNSNIPDIIILSCKNLLMCSSDPITRSKDPNKIVEL